MYIKQARICLWFVRSRLLQVLCKSYAVQMGSDSGAFNGHKCHRIQLKTETIQMTCQNDWIEEASGYFVQDFWKTWCKRMKQLVAVVSQTFHFLLSKPKLRIRRQNSCVHLQLLLSGSLVQENCRSQRIQQGLSAKMHKQIINMHYSEGTLGAGIGICSPLVNLHIARLHWTRHLDISTQHQPYVQVQQPCSGHHQALLPERGNAYKADVQIWCD